MTYCGMQIPAGAGTSIGRFERVMADIGDEQSIATNTSTFSAHLQRMREMLEGADGRTLVLVDEIGGGTEPSAGAALAIAMLERLLERGARGLVTTHATELKLFGHATPGVANASVRFDPQTFAPTFQLDVGAPGQSLAFPLARTLGIDAAIVSRAQQLLDNRERDYESALAELSLRTAEVQSERDALADERRRSALAASALASERGAFDAERRAFGAKAEERMQQALRDFARELQRRAAEAGTLRRKVTCVAGGAARANGRSDAPRAGHSTRRSAGGRRRHVCDERARSRAFAAARRGGRRGLRRYDAGRDWPDEDRRQEKRRAAARPAPRRASARRPAVSRAAMRG